MSRAAHFTLAFVVGVLLAMLPVGGCAVSLPDGIRIPLGTSESTVRTRFGEPDLVTKGEYGIWGSFPATRYYYLERRWELIFWNGRGLWVAHDLGPGPLDDLRNQARVFKEVVPRVPIGGSPEQVVAVFGVPDVVYSERHKSFIDAELYDGLLQRSGALRSFSYDYVGQEVVIAFSNGKVESAHPMNAGVREAAMKDAEALRAREKLATDDPPGMGMRSEDVRKRWGPPEVVSGQVAGVEYVTLPWSNPEERLGVEVTRWYYLARDRAVDLKDGEVLTIANVDPRRTHALNDFWERSFTRREMKIPVEQFR